MAILDILAQIGDGQDFVVEIPVGNASYVPADILCESDGASLCAEMPVIEPGSGGGNIFIMSE